MNRRIVLEKGVHVFGTIDKFAEWMNTFSKIFNCKPIKLWEENRLQELYDELGKIEYGTIA